MHVVLWDTRQGDVSKDFAGGFGIGLFHGTGGPRAWFVRRQYRRDRRPVMLTLAYLSGIFRRLGHTVEYALERVPRGADLYVFNPALMTLPRERQVIAEINRTMPGAKVLVTGLVATTMPERLADLDVTLVQGEAEQLYWKLDEVLSSDAQAVQLGSVKDLDELPSPDWSPFEPRQFRIAYDFWRFPTGLVQSSRGCTFTCNYCPYIVVENKTRFRDPQRVADEIRQSAERFGFRSFKFRDPLFGLDRKRALVLAEALTHLPRKVQFSIESRIDLLRDETLLALKEAGLTSITVGIERPDEETLLHYKRQPVRDDRQREFIARCRELGIRTVAGFLVGFPDDTGREIHAVLRYAKQLNPTFANFNVVTPYPGTEFYAEIRERIGDDDLSRYDMYTPVLEYKHLTREQVARLHTKCFTSFYFRHAYVRANAHLLWPRLAKLGLGGRRRRVDAPTTAEPSEPVAQPSLPILSSSDALRADGPHPLPQPTRPSGSRVDA